MSGDKLYAKAAQLLNRALDEKTIMRGFYENLAKSYYRLALEADRRAEKLDIEHAQSDRRAFDDDEILRRMRVTLNSHLQ